jgi:hypothetical protein
MRLFARSRVLFWLTIVLTGGAGSSLTGWPHFLSDNPLADTGALKAYLERQQEAKAAQPVPNWRELLEPVRPPLEPDVFALSDKERDGLLGPVKQVREGYQFTSADHPEWNSEWANAPESDYYRTISYDVNGIKVSDVRRPGCGTHPPEKTIYDTKGRVVECITYTDDAVADRRVLLSYDFRGWLIEANEYGDGATHWRLTYEYVVDSRGNWISQIPRCAGGCPPIETNGLQGVICRSVTYYE